VGLLCAFGWWTLGLNTKHSAVDLDCSTEDGSSIIKVFERMAGVTIGGDED
jgi:hypothetical protein